MYRPDNEGVCILILLQIKKESPKEGYCYTTIGLKKTDITI